MALQHLLHRSHISQLLVRDFHQPKLFRNLLGKKYVLLWASYILPGANTKKTNKDTSEYPRIYIFLNVGPYSGNLKKKP